MAINLREAPLAVQLLLGLVLAAIVIAAGLYLPIPPVHGVRQELAVKRAEEARLENKVAPLEQVKRNHAELMSSIEEVRAQLRNLEQIVPVEKDVDEFIRMMQGAAANTNVNVRRLTARPLVPKAYHVEMPFEVEVDGPYYNVLNFFAALSRLARITNVGDLSFSGLGDRTRPRYPVSPGTTVTGTFLATTFFTRGAEGPPPEQPGKARPGKAPAKAPAKQPAKR